MSEFNLEQTEIEEIIEKTTLKVLISLGKLPPFLSKRKAFKLYGEGNVKNWINKQLITVEKNGDNTSNCQISRTELEKLSRQINRTNNNKL